MSGLEGPNGATDYDVYDLDQAFFDNVTRATPPCFVVLGKPGAGSTTVATSVAEIRRCKHLSPPVLIEDAMAEGTELGKEATSILFEGGAVGDDLVWKMLDEALLSPDVVSRGYVLDGFPLQSEQGRALLAKLTDSSSPLPISHVISLDASDEDLSFRRSDLRMDPVTGILYSKEQYAPPPRPIMDQEVVHDQDSIDGDEDDYEGNDKEGAFDESLLEPILPVDVVGRLVKRPEDLPKQLTESLQSYREHELQLHAELAQQYAPGLRAILVNGAEQRLAMMNGMNMLLGTRIIKGPSPAAEVQVVPETLEGADRIPDVLQYLNDNIKGDEEEESPSLKLLWNMSLWGRYCPVSLAKGRLMEGDARYCAGYCGRLFFFTSPEAANEFASCPRKFLLEPPRVPFHLWIVGQPLSGVSMLAKRAAESVKADVVDVDALIRRHESGGEGSNADLRTRICAALCNGEDIPASVYVDALKLELEGRSSWVLDGFPYKVEHARALLDAGLAPQTVVTVKDGTDGEVLRKRLEERVQAAAEKDLPGDMRSSVFEASLTASTQALFALTEFLQAQKITEVSADASQALDTTLRAVGQAVNPFARAAQAHKGGVDDTTQLGATKNFCPVVLKDHGQLHVGSEEFSVDYLDRTYMFATREGMEQFVNAPSTYVNPSESLKAPVLRVLVLGVEGEWRTRQCKRIAKEHGLAHINFVDHLKELGEREEYPHRIVVHNHVWRKEPIAIEVIKEILTDLWKNEQGLALEGFPRTEEEANLMPALPAVPDLVISLQIEAEEIGSRKLKSEVDKLRRRAKLYEEQQRRREEEEAIKAAKAAAAAAEGEEGAAAASTAAAAQGGDSSAGAAAAAGGEVAGEAPALALMPKEGDVEADELFEVTNTETLKSRLTERLVEAAESDVSLMNGLSTLFEAARVPRVEVPAVRRSSDGLVDRALKAYADGRPGLLEFFIDLDLDQAETQLEMGVRTVSRFGRWDPVMLVRGQGCAPVIDGEALNVARLAVAHRAYVYFFVSEENRAAFKRDPMAFVRTAAPPPPLPCAVAVVGPPKSGKSLLCERLVRDLGVMRLSMGVALRHVLDKCPGTMLAADLNNVLVKGEAVPDKLAIKALALVTRSAVCQTRGYVLDGFPTTKRQCELLLDEGVNVNHIIELEVPDEECLARAALDRHANAQADGPHLHDSERITAERIAVWRERIVRTRAWFMKNLRNWHVLDAKRSKWWVAQKGLEGTCANVRRHQVYAARTLNDLAAAVHDLCIRDDTFEAGLSPCGLYCPVSLVDKDELVDCAGVPGVEFAAQHNNLYYKMAGAEELKAFLHAPDKYAKCTLPEHLPKREHVTDLQAIFPRQLELQGNCPVQFVLGEKLYASIVPGVLDYVAEYRDKLYTFASEDNLERFMRRPQDYCSLQLPRKLPPVRAPVNVASLPLLGYLEQTVASAITKVLTAVGIARVKHPWMSVTESALRYIALSLKAENERHSDYTRRKYKRLLREFIYRCELIPTLAEEMGNQFVPPKDRSSALEARMQHFLALRETKGEAAPSSALISAIEAALPPVSTSRRGSRGLSESAPLPPVPARTELECLSTE